MQRNRWKFVLVLVAAPCMLAATEVRIPAAQDNSIFSEGDLSNGAGQYLFAGTTNGQAIRRALLRFDVAAHLPVGATINSARVELLISKTVSGNMTMALHRMTAAWGEGASDATGEEGTGAEAAAGDATWDHRFFDTDAWTSAGGDYVATPSATATAGSAGTSVSFSGSGVATDLAEWLSGTNPNHGWIVLGNESAGATSKRFHSREHTATDTRPVLVIDYTGAGAGADGWVIY